MSGFKSKESLQQTHSQDLVTGGVELADVEKCLRESEGLQQTHSQDFVTGGVELAMEGPMPNWLDKPKWLGKGMKQISNEMRKPPHSQQQSLSWNFVKFRQLR